MNDCTVVVCPFCDGTDTRLFAAFGSQLAVSTYWCNACRSAFEKLKTAGRPAPDVTSPPG